MSNLPQMIVIGNQGEENARHFPLDASEEFAMWEGATPTLFYIRPTETRAYISTVEQDGTTLIWTPDAFAMAKQGNDGSAVIVFTIPGTETVIGRSPVMRLVVASSIAVDDAILPDPYDTYLEQLLELSAEAVQASEEAQGYAQDANTAKTQAETAQTKAEQAQGLAEDARDASILAQTKAETAQDKAEVAQGKAELAQERAEQAQGYAESAKDDAVQAKTDAQSARDLAQGYASNASQSATTASNKAQEASGYATQTALDAQATGADRTAVSNLVNGFDQKVLDAEGAIRQEGTTQIGLVNTAGITQITAIETKINTFSGIEILEEGESPQHESTEVTLTPDAETVDQIPQIDDTQLSAVDTWSSNKIHAEDCFEVSASGSVVTVNDGADNVPIKSMTVQIVAQQSGEGDPSPSNVRPISGFDSVTITQQGYNGFSNPIGGYSYDAYGKIVSSSSYKMSDKVPSKKGDTIILQYTYNGGHNRRIGAYNAYDQFLGFVANNNPSANHTYDLSFANSFDDCVYIMCALPNNAVSTAVFKGNADKEIEIEFPQEAGTVYGGTLVINEDGSGTLTVDSQYIEITKDTPIYSFTDGSSTQRALVSYNNVLPYSSPSVSYQTVISNWARKETSTSGEASKNVDYWSCRGRNNYTARDILIWSPYGNELTEEMYKEILEANPLQIVISLATPIKYTLTEQQIKTFFAYNQFQANSGDISLTYRADKKLYVDTRLAELRALIGG